MMMVVVLVVVDGDGDDDGDDGDDGDGGDDGDDASWFQSFFFYHIHYQISLPSVVFCLVSLITTFF